MHVVGAPLDPLSGPRYVERPMLELSDHLSIRAFRLEANYTAARLKANEETRALGKDFEEAADKFALLEEEQARLDVRRMETQASVETADDEWDDTMISFQSRLLEKAGNSVDAELYRRYFADIPSQVTSLSYAAEILISKDLEADLQHEEIPELAEFASRLEEKRIALEAIIHERTRLEVDEARFANRVQLAKAILNKLRRILFAGLEEIAIANGRGRDWCVRFYHRDNAILASIDNDGVEQLPATTQTAQDMAALPANGEEPAAYS